MPLLILILPLTAAGLAQLIKFIASAYRSGLKSKMFFSYSGMPSGHSAMVVSLATILGLKTGWDSPIFSLSVILAAIVIRDALGLRQYLGQHGKILNILVKDLKDDYVLDEQYPHLLEKIGHTPAQVIAGSALGIFVSLAGFVLFN